MMHPIYSVVDNRWQGEGFAWVIENLPHSEHWKYNVHGQFTDKVEADQKASDLNAAWGV